MRAHAAPTHRQCAEAPSLFPASLPGGVPPQGVGRICQSPAAPYGGNGATSAPRDGRPVVAPRLADAPGAARAVGSRAAPRVHGCPSPCCGAGGVDRGCCWGSGGAECWGAEAETGAPREGECNDGSSHSAGGRVVDTQPVRSGQRHHACHAWCPTCGGHTRGGTRQPGQPSLGPGNYHRH